jgi:hypothetical protein
MVPILALAAVEAVARSPLRSMQPNIWAYLLSVFSSLIIIVFGQKVLPLQTQ